MCVCVGHRVPYRGARGCVYMDNTLDVRPGSVDGRVENEAGLVDPEVGAAPVHNLTLNVDLHLESNRGKILLHLMNERV